MIQAKTMDASFNSFFMHLNRLVLVGTSKYNQAVNQITNILKIEKTILQVLCSGHGAHLHDMTCQMTHCDCDFRNKKVCHVKMTSLLCHVPLGAILPNISIMSAMSSFTINNSAPLYTGSFP